MHHHAKDVAWAGKHSVGPDGVLEGETLLLVLARVARVLSHELVDLVVRWIRKYIIAVIVVKILVLLPLCLRNRLPEFPIRLTIELVCLDEDRATLCSGLKQNEVGRYALSLVNLDDHANRDVFGGDGNYATMAG